MESQFQVSDLLTDDNPVYPRRQVGREKKHTTGF